MTTARFLTLFLCLSTGATRAQSWPGYVEKSMELGADAMHFGAPGGSNENYYDGDFADYDLDGRIDRGLISRFGLIWNTGGGVFLPVSTQRVDPATGNASGPQALRSFTGFRFGDGYAGNDGIQWADIDGDGDPDSIQGGNGEPFVIQSNRAGRFFETGRHGGSALNIANTDIEGDGDVDLVVAHSFCSNRNCGGPVDFRLWVNDGNGNYSDESAARGLGQYRQECQLVVGVTSGDVDGDGDFDIAMLVGAHDLDRCPAFGGLQRNALIINVNDGNGNFTETVHPFGRPATDIPWVGSGFGQNINLGDIDGDGDLDVVTNQGDADDGTTPGRDPVGLHPDVSHIIMINDGAGNFSEESDLRFVAGTPPDVLVAGNSKLSDVDFDGDLDFIAFNKPGPDFFQLFLNDGTGVFTYRPDLDVGGWQALDQLGVDVDIADLDHDGTYDLWIGVAKLPPNLLINPYSTPSGIRADLPRNFRIDSTDATSVTLSWDHPPWAAVNRHYKVLRSVAANSEPRDRPVLDVIAMSPHEDDSFVAPLSASTTTAQLGHPDVILDGMLGARGRVYFTDRTAVPGVPYRYSVIHVGTERSASIPTWELEATVPHPDPASPDIVGPELAIVSPTWEEWSTHPRIVVEHADDLSGIDPASLEVFFDQALGTGDPGTGGAAAFANIADRFSRRDDGTYIFRLDAGLALPVGLATLTVRVSDMAGNMSERNVTMNVTVTSPEYPTACFNHSLRAGLQLVDLDANCSSDTDGAILRWEWDFGDGSTGIGRDASHRYRDPGDYMVRLVVRDDEGGVSESSTLVTVPDIPDADEDGDGVLDRDEIDRGTDPTRADTDADGSPDALDCASLDGLAGVAVNEVADLRLDGGTSTTLSWVDQTATTGAETRHAVIEGGLTALHSSGIPGTASCANDQIAGGSWATSDAARAGGTWYLVRAQNLCGLGPWGADSFGTPRDDGGACP